MLPASVLLAGCVVASEEGDEQTGERGSDLDPVAFEQAPGSQGHGDARVREIVDAAALPARGPTRLPSVEERLPAATYVRSREQEKADPAPIPWQPQEGSEVSAPSSSGSDGTR
ncbi:hypothetical protein [Sorangium cellulosum]|uniref:hypothetical protein n=1 Tax=Sorangium cellulosum TaxID=56 RepID=UPI000CF508A6|nr:hypothetical protein [Sorangium cellulosum]